MGDLLQERIRVGLVDDHPFVHKGFSAVIDRDPELHLAWTATSAELELLQVLEDPVNVLIVDVKLGSFARGFEILESIQYSSTLAERARTIVLSAYVSRRMVWQAARLGACGYFVKTQAVEEVLEAVKRAGELGPGTFLGPFSDWAKPNPFLELSKREIEVLIEMGKGRSNQEVAAILGLKIGTIKTHLESVYRKLGVNSRTEALRQALVEGYFHLEELI